jgi:hypothetical protein
MEYVAVAVAIFGVAIGLTSRLRFLLGMVVTVCAITLIFVLSQPYGVLRSLVVIMVAQALLQGGYVTGLVGRHFFSRIQSRLSGLSGPEAKGVRQHRES